MKHSSGPWRMFRTYPAPSKTPDYPESERSGIDRNSFKVADNDASAGNPMCRGNLVAHIYNFSGNAERDARLITSAPDLLATLQKLHANAAEPVDWIRRVISEAIEKATGEKP